MKRRLAVALAIVALPWLCMAQSGGLFEITRTVIGGSGGPASSGNFSLESTGGQPFFGGDSSNPPFALTVGFWNFTTLTPTAAPVLISGRVISARGSGIKNVRVTLASRSGNVRASLTNAFGYYRFEDVTSGETYLLTVTAKRYVFSQPSRVINVFDAISDADFIADN